MLLVLYRCQLQIAIEITQKLPVLLVLHDNEKFPNYYYHYYYYQY